jgi:hypothetical protein
MELLTPEQMDDNAEAAKGELEDLLKHSPFADGIKVVVLADWWKRWRDLAGHKRLGRIIVKYAK